MLKILASQPYLNLITVLEMLPLRHHANEIFVTNTPFLC